MSKKKNKKGKPSTAFSKQGLTAFNAKTRPTPQKRKGDDSPMKKKTVVELEAVQVEVSPELQEALGGVVEQTTSTPNALMTQEQANTLAVGNGTKGVQLTPERAKEIRKLRTTYGKRLPALACDNCPYAQQCGYFKPGYECAFGEVIKGIKLETEQDLQDAMTRIAEANMTTAELGLIQQRLAGGVIDDKTSGRLDSAFGQLAELARMKLNGKGGLPSGSESISGQGIIEKLFGGLARVMEAAGGKPAKEITINTPASVPVQELKEEEVAKVLKTEKEKELDEVLGEFEKEN